MYVNYLIETRIFLRKNFSDHMLAITLPLYPPPKQAHARTRTPSLSLAKTRIRTHIRTHAHAFCTAMRLCDKLAAVRAQAVKAAQRLQDPSGRAHSSWIKYNYMHNRIPSAFISCFCHDKRFVSQMTATQSYTNILRIWLAAINLLRFNFVVNERPLRLHQNKLLINKKLKNKQIKTKLSN